MRIDDFRKENFLLKKSLLFEKKKNIDLQNQYIELKKAVAI